MIKTINGFFVPSVGDACLISNGFDNSYAGRIGTLTRIAENPLYGYCIEFENESRWYNRDEFITIKKAEAKKETKKEDVVLTATTVPMFIWMCSEMGKTCMKPDGFPIVTKETITQKFSIE